MAEDEELVAFQMYAEAPNSIVLYDDIILSEVSASP